jgi:diadenylate cyclase
MSATYDALLKDTLQRTAPGTDLREGLERILRGRTGALIVLGENKKVSEVSTGGFLIHTEFSAAKLRELAKMDGGIVLNKDATMIHSAAVHFMPDSTIEAIESGTRHRTAERLSVDTGFPVIAVSASMNIIALFINGHRYTLDRTELILERANQALNTLERYRERLESVMQHLSTQEIEASVSVRDVATALQRQEMVRRIIREISTYALELGTEGRLVTLQLEELASGTEGNTELLLRDYSGLLPETSAQDDGEMSDAEGSAGSSEDPTVIESQLKALSRLSNAELVDLAKVASILGIQGGVEALEEMAEPKGHRLLSQMRNVPRTVSDRIVDHFGGLQSLLAASIEELMEVDGVGGHRARIVRETLSRMAEINFYDRH